MMLLVSFLIGKAFFLKCQFRLLVKQQNIVQHSSLQVSKELTLGLKKKGTEFHRDGILQETWGRNVRNLLASNLGWCVFLSFIVGLHGLGMHVYANGEM